MSISPVQLTRNQRREIQKLAGKVDRITDSDRRYFERFPHRQYRVRPAGESEIASQNAAGDNWPPGAAVYAVIRNALPGMRFRALVQIVGPVETDVSEEAAKALFESVAPKEMRA